MENNVEPKKQLAPTASAILEDGTIVEMAFQTEQRRTFFSIYSAGRWTLQDGIDLGSDARLVPLSPNNNLIKNEVVLLPSEPRIYGSEANLVVDVQQFIHRYVDLSPTFERVATCYVLLSWLYDAFLRLRGDYGSGKTRALLAIGSLCYKPFFASGASTVSPIFHTLDAFRGTLIFDEADFRFSDEKAEIVKILNNGNIRGLPVLRTMMNHQREFNPRAFHVFGPKIVATRGSYDDKGLESRFLTEEMGSRQLRSDIPINLPESFKDEARDLRNKLLLYRFHRRFKVKLDESLVDPKLEPRLNQMLLPLLSVVSDESLRSELRSMARDAAASEPGWLTFCLRSPISSTRLTSLSPRMTSSSNVNTATGTQRGQLGDIPASGRVATRTGMNIFRIECGLIAEVWAQVDAVTSTQQLI